MVVFCCYIRVYGLNCLTFILIRAILLVRLTRIKIKELKMYSRGKGNAYEFRCTEVDAIARKVMWNNILLVCLAILTLVFFETWFSFLDHQVMNKYYDLYRVGFILLFMFLVFLLFAVVSIRPNDRFKRFLKRIEDRMFALK